jgi:hypothetical protein
MKLKKLYHGFIWVDSEGRGNKHLVNWKTLCHLKAHDGLDLHNMHYLNKAFIMKLGWEVLNDVGYCV